MKKFIMPNKEEMSYLIKPLIFLAVLIIALPISVIAGISQISNLVAKINETKKIEAVLGQKITVLEKVSDLIPSDMTLLDLVVPNKSAVLYGVSQIKNQAVKYTLVINNLKSGKPVPLTEGLSKTSITFDVEEESPNLLDFLKSFETVLPIIKVSSVNVSKSASVSTVAVTVDVYSSELPKTIPSISDSASELTAEEISLLQKLFTYSLPSFLEGSVKEETPKEDPFN